MKNILGAALFTALFLLRAEAQTETKLPELPSPAGSEATMPAIPSPTSTYDTMPSEPSGPVALPQRQMSQEEIQKLKQDENWLVEGMKKKQEEQEAAQLLKKASDLNSKKDDLPKEPAYQPGELANFKPVVADSSLASLTLNQGTGFNSNQTPAKRKAGDLTPLPLASGQSSSNPLSTSSSTGLVQPILGPNRQGTDSNITNLNPGLAVTPLPQTGIKKISSNPNFIPDGYADSWSQQQDSPYKPLTPQAPAKPLMPSAPVAPRPTFKDLANTIPDPSQVR